MTRNNRVLDVADLLGPTGTSAKYAGLSEKTKAVALADRLQKAFKINLRNGHVTVGGFPDDAEMKNIVEDVVHMWPHDFGTKYLEDESLHRSDYRILYWGRQFPNGIAAAVNRASLYADTIYVVNPFIDLFTYTPEKGPLASPAAWKQIYALNAATLTLLLPWIEADIVKIVCNPMTVSYALRQEFMDAGEARWAKWKTAYDKIAERTMVEAGAEVTAYLSDREFDQLQDAHKQDGETLALIRAARDELRTKEPVFSQFPQGVSSVMKSGAGLNLEAAALVSGMFGSAIATDVEWVAEQLRLAQPTGNRRLQPLALAFSSLKFDFLNSVSPSLALSIRKDGKIHGFRRYLNDMVALSGGTAGFPSADQQRHLKERLEDEYETYKAEWKDIQRSLLKGTVAAPLLTSAPLVLTGTFAVLPALAGTAVGWMKSLFSTVTARRKLERKPLSLFMRLDRR